ncbi:UNVERIFIED_CONTAM: hypothetical protein Sindi_1861000 [Sesamum indicum]
MTSTNENPWGQDPAAEQPARLGGPTKTLSRRLSDKFKRTKEAAALGMEKTKEKTKVAARKVKEGASSSINWLKLKCKLVQPKRKEITLGSGK